jgi:hypothetical protein
MARQLVVPSENVILIVPPYDGPPTGPAYLKHYSGPSMHFLSFLKMARQLVVPSENVFLIVPPYDGLPTGRVHLKHYSGAIGPPSLPSLRNNW